jgi:hypothetical protein
MFNLRYLAREERAAQLNALVTVAHQGRTRSCWINRDSRNMSLFIFHI